MRLRLTSTRRLALLVPVAVAISLLTACKTAEPANSVEEPAPPPVEAAAPPDAQPAATETAVPKVKGVTQAKAKAALEAAGLKVAMKESYSKQAPGTVLNQTPAQGQSVDPGAKVMLVIAMQIPKIPSVMGKSSGAAKKALKAAGYRVKVTTAYSNNTAGTVIVQRPSNGQSAKPGKTVTITIAKAPPAETSTGSQGTTGTGGSGGSGGSSGGGGGDGGDKY